MIGIYRSYSIVMAGQNINRTARYELTGLTDQQRDVQILKLSRAGWTQVQIAKKFGIAQSAVHYSLLRSRGIKRKTYRYEACDGCGSNFAPSELVDFFCKECR